MTTQNRPLPLSSSQGFIAGWDWDAADKDLAEDPERGSGSVAASRESKESKESEKVVDEDDAEMRYWSGRGEVSMIPEEEEEEEEEEEIEIGSGPKRLFGRVNTSTSVHFALIGEDEGSGSKLTNGLTRKSTDRVNLNLDEPPLKRIRRDRDDSGASVAFGSRLLDTEEDEDGFSISSSPIPCAGMPYPYDPTLKPLICRQLDTGREFLTAPSNESCRAYRTFPADRFMWYHFHKKDNPSRMAILSRLRDIDYKDPESGRTRRFVFLGTTEGRLRSGEVCFFEESPDLTAKDVREAFGDLQGVFMKDGVGKYVARTGLSFTSTWETIRVEEDQVAVVDDVEAPDGKDYTDGCGCIALEAAEEIAGKLGLEYTPTAFQIRYGGAKGMIVAYRRADLDRIFPEHKGAILYLRPSMRKYAAPNFRHIEVAGWTKPAKWRTGKLQRAFIQVLHTLGVPLETFEDLLKAELERIESVRLDREKALLWLQRDGADLCSGDQTLTNATHRMIMAGHDMQEPRLLDLTGRLVAAGLYSLREKLSIPIDDSTYVYGICDELGDLEGDQVVVHTSRNDRGYIEGDVLVTRSPCGHPGDIRILKAVRPGPGSLWRDCIVFPFDGNQPFPDQMSGGDLDGDEYFVCWDERLHPPNREAPNPRAPKPKKPFVPPAEYTDEHVVAALRDHVVEQLNNYDLGESSKAWERATEESVDGAKSKLSLYLNARYEACMDTNKSGEQIPPKPTDDEKVLWLGKKREIGPVEALQRMIPVGGQIQATRKMLQTPKKRDSAESVELHAEVRQSFVRDQDLIYYEDDPKWQQYYKEFTGLRKSFAASMAQAQRRLEGSNRPIAKTDRSPHKGQADTHKRNVNKQLEETDQGLMKQHRQIHFSPATDSFLDLHDYMIKASAFYAEGYDSIRSGQWTRAKLSLAWLGEDYLHLLKATRTNKRNELNRLPVAVAHVPKVDNSDTSAS